MENIELIKKAIEARKMAYTPYSKHKVGAALLCSDGSVFMGCNIENAAYGPTVCAERVAIFKAVSEGHRDFERIAVVGGLSEEKMELCAPCGVCRQVMREFADPDSFEIVLAQVDKDMIKPQVFTLNQLLPLSFGPDNLKDE